MFEFVIPQRPVSVQTRRRERLAAWKALVRGHAEAQWQDAHQAVIGTAAVTLVYLYEEAALDVDNIIKPIQDALVGLAYVDDTIITDVTARRRQLSGHFDLTNVPTVLADAVAGGRESVYVRISPAPPQEELL
jgi:crossover junction endodeoxyribonuclease RusA